MNKKLKRHLFILESLFGGMILVGYFFGLMSVLGFCIGYILAIIQWGFDK